MQLSSIVSALIKLAESIRSSISKVSLVTITEMLTQLKRCMEPYLENIMKVMIKRAALDTNTFISEEADKALTSMCFNC